MIQRKVLDESEPDGTFQTFTEDSDSIEDKRNAQLNYEAIRDEVYGTTRNSN
jgi:hypothetical protein